MSPPYYRIIVNSVDAMQRTVGSGFPEWRDGYYTIDIPDFLPNDQCWQLGVESFNMSQYVTPGLVMHCDSFTQANSYSTSSQGNSNVLFTFMGGSFKQNITTRSIGMPINDLTFMRGKIMRFFLTTLDGQPIANIGQFSSAGTTGLFWSMSLIVYPIHMDGTK